MSANRLHIVLPDPVAEFAETGPLHTGLCETARLVGADLALERARAPLADTCPGQPGVVERPVRYRGRVLGRVTCETNWEAVSAGRAVDAMAAVLEHIVDREMAVEDLAAAMTTGYEELHMLHGLLADIAIRTDAAEIGELLVDETARTLNCRRVSLMMFDARRENLKILASRGLPPEARSMVVPVSQSLAGRVCLDDGLLVVENIRNHPDLLALSRGNYQGQSFAIIRVPLNARGEAVGVLAATEHAGEAEFTTRDRKLLEGLSSIGASALLNCHLHAKVSEQMMSTIQALASAVDAKDHYTHSHSARVAELCVATARRMGITDPATCREMELAGLLHDIGKIGIPDSILSKTARLTSEEYATIKTHVQIGARIVEHVPGLEQVAKAILYHHERHDGLGYPAGLTGSAIPLAAKLISATDVFDTLTSDRPYRKATTVEDAILELRRSKNTQQDPEVVDILIAVVTEELNLVARLQEPCLSTH